MSPNVYNVSYTHCSGGDQSAARGARYITRRPEEREEGKEPIRESGWREIDSIGDREQFVKEANARRDAKRERAEENGKDLSKDKSPGAAQYTHFVLSPENGERMTDEGFHRLAEEWTRDEAGREYAHVGAIHRDSGSQGNGEGHDHMHLLVARDKLSKREIEERKELSEEAVKDIERARGIYRDQELDRDRNHNCGDREPAGERRESGSNLSQDHESPRNDAIQDRNEGR